MQFNGRIVKNHHHGGLKHKNNHTRWLSFYVHQPTKPLFLGKTSSLRYNNQSQVFDRERWRSLFSTLGPSLSLQDQGHQNSQADPQGRVLQPSKHAPRQTRQVSYAEKEASVMKQKAEIEASLLKQKADLEASLYVLQIERTAAAALAEAAAFEEAVGSEHRELRKELDTGTQPLSPVQRTCEHVQQHARPYFAEFPFEVETQELSVDPATCHNLESSKQRSMSRDSPFERNEQQHGGNGKQAHFQSHTQSFPESQVAPDLIKYLLRREMVSSGLLKFDDRPENDWAWKASFLNATRDLNLSAREELDLITKWLGAESSEQAKRIRSVHILNTTAGLTMVWQ